MTLWQRLLLWLLFWAYLDGLVRWGRVAFRVARVAAPHLPEDLPVRTRAWLALSMTLTVLGWPWTLSALRVWR